MPEAEIDTVECPADQLHKAAKAIHDAVAESDDPADAAVWAAVAEELDALAAEWVDRPDSTWAAFTGLPAALSRAIIAFAPAEETTEAEA